MSEFWALFLRPPKFSLYVTTNFCLCTFRILPNIKSEIPFMGSLKIHTEKSKMGLGRVFIFVTFWHILKSQKDTKIPLF